MVGVLRTRGMQPEPQAIEGESSQVRRAVEIVLKTLARLDGHPEAGRLMVEAKRLLAETDRWRESPPAPEIRSHAMRAALSIHLAALRATAGAARR